MQDLRSFLPRMGATQNSGFQDRRMYDEAGDRVDAGSTLTKLVYEEDGRMHYKNSLRMIVFQSGISLSLVLLIQWW